MSTTQLARVQAALHTVALAGFERRTIGSLSSGQLQRLLFARLLVQDADLILLDEPFNAVDSHTAARLLDQLSRGTGTTVGPTLCVDALSAPGGPATSYLQLMPHHISAWARGITNHRN